MHKHENSPARSLPGSTSAQRSLRAGGGRAPGRVAGDGAPGSRRPGGGAGRGWAPAGDDGGKGSAGHTALIRGAGVAVQALCPGVSGGRLARNGSPRGVGTALRHWAPECPRLRHPPSSEKPRPNVTRKPARKHQSGHVTPTERPVSLGICCSAGGRPRPVHGARTPAEGTVPRPVPGPRLQPFVQRLSFYATNGTRAPLSTASLASRLGLCLPVTRGPSSSRGFPGPRLTRCSRRTRCRPTSCRRVGGRPGQLTGDATPTGAPGFWFSF